MGVGERMQQRGHHAHLGRRGKGGAARDDALQAARPDGVYVVCGMRGHAEQKRHVACALAGVHVRLEPLGNTHRHDARRDAPRAMIATDELDVDAVKRRGPVAVPATRASLKMHEVGKHTLPAAADRIDKGQDVGVAAVVGRHAHVARLRDPAPVLPEHTHVRTPEAVDGLLGVAHGRNPAPPATGKEAYELELAGISVLKLVHHHEAKPTGVVGRHLGFVPHGSKGEADEVIVVKKRALGLEPSVTLFDRASERERGAQGRNALREDDVRPGLLEDTTQIEDELGVRLRGTRKADGADLAQQLAGCRGVPLPRRPGGEVAHKVEGRVDPLRRRRREPLGMQALVGAQKGAHGLADIGSLSELEAIEAPCRSLGHGTEPVHDPHGTRARGTRRTPQPEGVEEHGLVLVPAAGRVRGSHDLDERPVLKQAGLVLCGHAKRGIKSQVEGMAPQDARAHAMDRADPGRVNLEGRLAHTGVTQGRAHALPYLPRGGVGEGDDQHLGEVAQKGGTPLAGARAERLGNTPREGEGLARARSRLDEERPLESRGNAQLFGAQARKPYLAHLDLLMSQFMTGQ